MPFAGSFRSWRYGSVSKAFATKLDDLGLIPETFMAKRLNQLLYVVLKFPHGGL